MAETREEILGYLRSHGPTEAEDVAAAVGVHVSVARHHLEGLASRGLVRVEVRRKGRGRPAKVYRALPSPASPEVEAWRNLVHVLARALESLGEEGEEALRRAAREEARLRARSGRTDVVADALSQFAPELSRASEEKLLPGPGPLADLLLGFRDLGQAVVAGAVAGASGEAVRAEARAVVEPGGRILEEVLLRPAERREPSIWKGVAPAARPRPSRVLKGVAPLRLVEEG